MNREELIEKMLTAYWGEDMDAQMHKTRIRMAAALDVVLGEVLGEPSKEEVEAADLCADACCLPDAGKLFNNRRAHYSKVKTAEERIKVEGYPMCVNWSTLTIDGNAQVTVHNDYLDAVKTGLIAQLKAGQQ